MTTWSTWLLLGWWILVNSDSMTNHCGNSTSFIIPHMLKPSQSTAKNPNLTALFPNLFPRNFHLDLVWLVVGPPLWKILVNWDDEIPNINGKIKLMATKPPTSSDTPWAYLCRASYVLGPDWPASARPPVPGPASSPRGWCSAAWPGRRPTARRRLRRTAGPKPTTW